ncbi:MAG: PQQ-binding-like beta-propeller repeat protein [Candidatus Fimenecus sp.]
MSKKHMVILIFVLAIVLIAAVVLAVVFRTGGPYTGKVIEAESGAPVAGVRVSDGRHVVQTDENGCFTVKGWRKTNFITVTVPAGYTAETYYIRTNKNTESYDFTLAKSTIPAGAAHSFLQISDTEIGEGGTGEWLEHIKTVAASQDAAFLIHTGDICYEAGLKRHIQDMNTETMGLPVYYCIGNHDYVDGNYGEELFESLYGPTWYSFEIGNVHYIVTPFGRGADKSSRYSKRDCLLWLKNDLENTDPNMKIVMFNHTQSPSETYILKCNGQSLDLKAYNLIAWVFGHYHYNYVEENNGVLNISAPRPDCGGIDSSASGTRQILIDADGTVTTKMYYYDFSKETAAAPQNAVWSTALGENILFCDTVYQDGKVYTATVQDDVPRACGIYCLSSANGSVIWQYKTENSVKNNVVLSGDRLYAQDAAGNVYCLSAETGTLQWTVQVNLGNALAASSALCVADGKVFAGGAAGVTALQADTGSILWENIRNKGEASPAEFIVTGNKLIVSSHWDALVALDTATGKQIWENKDGDIRFRTSTPVAVDENTLLVADSGAIMLVDSNTGEIISKTALENYNFSSSAQPVVNGNTAYIATANKGVLAFDLTTHEILWETPVGNALVGTAPYVGKAQTVESTFVLDGDTLVFGASDGNLYRISASDGAVLQTVAVGAPIFGKAANADGDWIVGDFAGRVSRVHF